MYVPIRKQVERDRLATADRGLALHGTHSLIQVPEHPDVWKSDSILINPEQVIHRLSVELQNWDGRHTVKDFGVEMGIYQEGARRHPER